MHVKKSACFLKIGLVSGISDGIVTLVGLFDVAYNATVHITTPAGKVVGLVLNIERFKVSAIVMFGEKHIKPGQFVTCTDVLMSVPVGEKLLGRIVDPLGEQIDELGSIGVTKFRMVEVLAPGIIERTPVNMPLETGLKVVDSLIPIGHGQRELIIGDSKTGKTSIAIDTILNQCENDTICIYVAIGQKRASVNRI